VITIIIITIIVVVTVIIITVKPFLSGSVNTVLSVVACQKKKRLKPFLSSHSFPF